MAMVHVRYLVDDVDAAVSFYTTHFGFTLLSRAGSAFADVTRGDLRLLLSGPDSSAGRTLPDGRTPRPGGWNRIHFVVDDIASEIARLRAAGVSFRSDVVRGPGGAQVVLDDPSGNPVELFQPARAPGSASDGAGSTRAGDDAPPSALASFEPHDVQAFARRWEELFDQGDYRSIAATYAEDARLIATGTETIEGRQMIERFWRTACEGARAAGVRRTVHVDEVESAGTLGHMRGTVALRRADAPEPITVRYVTLWRREGDGTWRLTTDISSAAPSASAARPG